MNLFRIFVVFFFTCTCAWAQKSNQDNYDVMIRESINRVRTLELAEMKSRGSVDAAKYIDLGKATLEVLQQSIPLALKQYDRLLRSESGILQSDAGRYYSQNQEAVDTVLRYLMESRFGAFHKQEGAPETSVQFGKDEQKKRIDLTESSLFWIRKHGAGPAFDPATSKWVAQLKEQAAWGRDTFAVINARNLLLDSYSPIGSARSGPD